MWEVMFLGKNINKCFASDGIGKIYITS